MKRIEIVDEMKRLKEYLFLIGVVQFVLFHKRILSSLIMLTTSLHMLYWLVQERGEKDER